MNERFKGPNPAFDSLNQKQAAVVIAVENKIGSAVDKVEEEVGVHGSLRIRLQARLQIRKTQSCSHLLQVELDLRQVKPGRITWQLQPLQQGSERKPLVIHGIEDGRPGFVHQITKCLLPGGVE